MIGGRPLSDEDWLYPDQPRRPLRTLLMGRRRFVVGMVTVALLVGVSSTAPPGATQSVTGAPAALPYFGLLPAVAYDAIRRQVVLFNNRGETWLWAKNRWTQAHPAVSPSGRIGAAAGWDPLMGAVLLVGGQPSRPHHEPGFAFSSMTLVHDPISGRLILLTIAPTTAGPAPPETWTWNGQDWSWQQTIGQQNAVAVAADGLPGMVLAFEDSSQDFKTQRIDAWEWTGNSWQPIRASSASG